MAFYTSTGKNRVASAHHTALPVRARALRLGAGMGGVKTALALRTKCGTPQKNLTAPMKYVDLQYYQKAFGAK
jgi:hypothetical protein